MAIIATQAFVLHHRDYSNTSKILYCLTKDYGLVHILAKGARNRKSAFFADCQPFRLIDIQFIKKTGLSLLTASYTVSLIELNDITKQFSGFYLNELLYRLIKTDYCDRSLFLLYLETMDNLLDNDDVELTLRTFEFKLFANLGYDFQSYIKSLNLDDANYQLSFPNMLFNKVESRLQNRHFIKKELGQRQEQGVDVFGGVFLSSLNSLKNINQYKKECKQFCRLVINFLLDGKPLKSRELFAQLK